MTTPDTLIGRHHPVALKVRTLIPPILRRRNVDVVDIRFEDGHLRVYADQAGGITIATLSELSQTLGDLFDAEDPIPGPYTLEVSSPGVDRPLATRAHYEAAQGERVMVVTITKIEGGRKHKGILTGISDTEVLLHVDGKTRHLPVDLIDSAHTIYTFETAPKPQKVGMGGGKHKKDPKPARQ